MKPKVEITRRELAGIAVGSSAGRLPGRSQAKYPEDWERFSGKVNPDDLDPVLFTRKLYESAPLRLTFRARNRKEVELWQKRLRAKLTELLGGFPTRHSPLNSQTLEIRNFPKYRREKFVFESRPGLLVLGYLLTPMEKQPPYRAMICVPGHGRGVDDIVGIDDKGCDRTDKSGYQHDFALQVVEQGVAAVAIEPMAFGYRRDARTKAKSLSANACQPAAGAALLLGQTMIGWRVWDVMRTMDWIETRREIDPARVGCMGISGGGTCTLFSSALEPRIRVALVSGYLNIFRDSILSLSHCIDNYVPGILNWCEMYDIGGLIAPRPLFVESGEKDNIFPIEASRAGFAGVKRVYDLLGVADHCRQEVFDASHSFHGVQGIPFLVKYLG